jgi:hypothetical protein
MKTFTIDAENHIREFATPEEAAATTATPFDSFASQKELGSLLGQWPAERLVAIWNSLPGAKPMKSFANAKTAAVRIWGGIQSLGEEPKPKAEGTPKGGAAKGKAVQKGRLGKSLPKTKKDTQKAAQAMERVGSREGSKTARVVAMLQRKNGATLGEIMEQMGWQKHTVRGFMAGAMKKAGYSVESFKSDKGERSYRVNQ